jgi:hypothetical protein
VVSALTVVNGLAGAVIAGAKGAAWGFAVAQAIGAILWWYQLKGAADEHSRRAEVDINSADDGYVALADDF